MTFEEFDKECALPLCRRKCKYFNRCKTLSFRRFINKKDLYNDLLKLYRKEKLEKLLT